MSLAVIAQDLSWQDEGRCVGAGLDVFFPDGGDSRRARGFCAGCPVWLECLAYGFDEESGVWGGLNRAERNRLRRLRTRFRVTPNDPQNSTDLRRLMAVAVGMTPERLSVLLNVPAETIAELGRPRPRRKAS